MLRDFEPFEISSSKPFLENAPILIVVFKKIYDIEGEERKKFTT